ncbi:MAG: cyclase family protein [Ardenticatenaceae bacterium]|nr:cyclase family protein [Ardenticatenaceae bacterium]
MNQLIDVSHTIEHEMITYRGLPAPIICDYLTRERSRQLYAPGTEFHIGKIEMIANTGTYVDSPFHRYKNGKDLSELPLTSLADLDALVIRTRERVVDIDLLQGRNVRGKAVLIDTGWSQHWRTDQYFENNPYLTAAAATYLRDEGAIMVGIDSLNIDNTADPTRPAHTILLGADIPIVEHLTHLHALPDANFRFFAVPVKVKAFGTFPVRAFGLIGD